MDRCPTLGGQSQDCGPVCRPPVSCSLSSSTLGALGLGNLGFCAPVAQPHSCPWGWVICLAEYTFCLGVWVQQGEGGTWKQWVRRGEESRGRGGCYSTWALDTPAGLHRVLSLAWGQLQGLLSDSPLSVPGRFHTCRPGPPWLFLVTKHLVSTASVLYSCGEPLGTGRVSSRVVCPLRGPD